MYSRFETLDSNPDIILGNDFARVGVMRNPKVVGSQVENLNTALVSGLNALKLQLGRKKTQYDCES